MIFFDLDGTLLDHDEADKQGVLTLQHHAGLGHIGEEAFYAVYRKLMEHIYEQYLRGELTFAGQRTRRITELLAHYRITVTGTEADRLFALYLESFERHWRCFPDVNDCLLRLADFEMGIITNGNREQQLQKLERLGLRSYFSVIIISEELRIAKPDKRIFAEACLKAGKRAEQCMYVGDRLHTDALAAKHAGMRGIWLNRGNEPFMEQAEVEVISSLSELLPA